MAEDFRPLRKDSLLPQTASGLSIH
jgi:hypothetical protein